MDISFDERLFFYENGYLIVRDLLAPSFIELALDSFEQGTPPVLLSKYSTDSLQGPFLDVEQISSDSGRVIRNGFRWLDRRNAFVGWMQDGFLGNYSIKSVAASLVNCPVNQLSFEIRGIYATLPIADRDHSQFQLTPHTDSHDFSLGVVAYLRDVKPSGGGFTVWPGTHQCMKHAYTKIVGGEKMYDYNILLRECLSLVDPVELAGDKGDVVFWSNRLIHGPSPNHSPSTRVALLGDYFLSH